MKNYENVFLLLIIYIEFLSNIQIINSSELDEVGKHVLISFRKEITNKGTDLSPDQYMQEIMYKQFYSKYNIGIPTQKIKFYYEINTFESQISEDYFQKIRSSTYKCMEEKCPTKNSEINDFNLTDKNGYISEDTFELSPDNKLDNFTFLLKPKGKDDESNGNEIPNIIGLGLNKNKINDELSFMEQLKRTGYIDKKIFTPLIGNDEISEARFFDGRLLVGCLPHEVDNIFEEKKLKWISIKDNTISNGNWHINFDTVKYNNEYIKDRIVNLDLSLNIIIGPESLRTTLINNFLKKNLENKKCTENLFYNLKNEEHYIYYSCSEGAEFIQVPSLSFHSKALNETFEISFYDLFTKYQSKIYFTIIFRKKVQNFWVFGQMFFNNYKFVFDTEEERIGYYKIKPQENHPFIAIACIVIALIIFFILYLNGNKFIIGKENVYYNQQLHNRLHPQVRSEYSNNENNSNENENERKKIKKSNKKAKKD